MEKPKLLVVEDDGDLATQMKWSLAGEYQVFLAGDRPSALQTVRAEHPDLVIQDLGLPPNPLDVQEGFQTLAGILELDPSAKVLIVTGRDERQHALNAIAAGAYDHFLKPVDVEELKAVLRRALHVRTLEGEYHALQRQLAVVGFDTMLGTSPQMQEVFNTIRKVATTDAPVLIVGESGSGKELVARAVHQLSERRSGPWVVINCGAIPENLLESELFGHEKGAFTGAHLQRKGRVEAAQGGSLLLDEVGELPLSLQVKLLRFLQEHTIERVGGRGSIAVDTRVMAATNVDFKQTMADGSFREDLYYRLSVVTIRVPPLRERLGDVALLARVFLDRYSKELGKKILGYSELAMRAVETYHWPGNVRELENRIKRAVIMAEGKRVTPADLELTSAPPPDERLGLREAREGVEREMVTQAIARTRGNLTRAAAQLGISRPTLYELMEKLGVKKS